MPVILTCFILVFVSEMGDKTQLLALVLAGRFKRPWTVMAGILVAALGSQLLASWLGGLIAFFLSPAAVRWIVGLSFLGFAAWMLRPEGKEKMGEGGHSGAFWTTVISMILAEVGDKDQMTTIALGARFGEPLRVAAGSTLGVLAADGLAVFFGRNVVDRVPRVWLRRAASLLFAVFGIVVLLRR